MKDTFYFVSMISGYCECIQGRNCGPCKHKFAIHNHFGVSGVSCLPQFDKAARAEWHFVATGQEVDPSWFRGLCDTSTHETEATQNDNNNLETSEDVNEDNEVNENVESPEND